MLTTRYPGLRRLFLQSLDADPVRTSEDDILALWKRPEDTPDSSPEWDLYRDFAAACLADADVFLIVEGNRPEQLISLGGEDEGLSVIERLLVVRECR